MPHHGYGTIGFYLSNVRVLNNSSHDNGQGGFYIADSPKANAVVKGNHSFRNATVEGIGLFIRDAAYGVVRDNVLEDNCVGLLVVGSQGRSTSHWAVEHNTVRDNTAACPASEDLPTPLSGLGIAVIGGQQVRVADNRITRNQPTGDTAVAGGIAVASAESFGGPDPVGNIVRANRATDNQPADLVYDGSGRGNRFEGNHCETSLPNGLCS